MPPLGPPYAPPAGGPPPPARFPEVPPEQWPATPVSLYGRPTSTPGTPPPREPMPTGVLVAIAVVVGLLIGAFAYSQTGGDPVARPFSTTTTTTTEPASSSAATTTTAQRNLQAVIDDIKAFVEKERGLKFRAEVPIKLADDQEFVQLLLAEFDKEKTRILEDQQVLASLNLISSTEDLIADEQTLLKAGVVGFYDPETKQLVVRGTSTTPYTRSVFAHELTHALDDQHFGLHRPQLDTADDETGFGFSALAEGNARRIENAYVASLSTDEQLGAQIEQIQRQAQHPEVFKLPGVLLQLLLAPYEEGEPLVRAILGTGGQARLDAAFTAPPSTSEQVIEPNKFLNGEAAVAVTTPTPTAGAPAANRGVLGVLLLRQLLDETGSVPSSTLAGWGGDQYVTWVDGARTCLRDNIVGGDAAATAHLGEALAGWARTNNATVEQSPDGYLTLTRCTG
jgi:hypothetical protein